jgi:hypothetical protein
MTRSSSSSLPGSPLFLNGSLGRSPTIRRNRSRLHLTNRRRRVRRRRARRNESAVSSKRSVRRQGHARRHRSASAGQSHRRPRLPRGPKLARLGTTLAALGYKPEPSLAVARIAEPVMAPPSRCAATAVAPTARHGFLARPRHSVSFAPVVRRVAPQSWQRSPGDYLRELISPRPACKLDDLRSF